MLLVHVYCGELWDSNFKKHFNAIHDYFMDPLYSIIFNQLATRLLEDVRETIKNIVDWCTSRNISLILGFLVPPLPHIYFLSMFMIG